MKRIMMLLTVVFPISFTLFMINGMQVRAIPKATFIVNSVEDAVDVNPGDGVCETGSGNGICTIRAAIQEANALSGLDSIVVPAGQYILTNIGANEDNAASGDLDIFDDLTITGDNSTTTIIDGNQTDRVFHIFAATVTIANLTVTNGEASGTYGGGGIYNDRDEDYNFGKLTLNNVIVKNNKATDAFGSGWNASGGGILSTGPLTVTNSIIADNETICCHGGGILSTNTLSIHATSIYSNVASVYGGGLSVSRIRLTDSVIDSNSLKEGGYASDGAGIYISTSAIIEDSTISNNVLSNGKGGGIFIGTNAQVTITHSTILTNAVTTDTGFTGTRGGGIYNESNQTVTISDSLIQGNISDDSGGGIYNDLSFGNGVMQLNRVTVSKNVASTFGAGIFTYADMNFTNVTVSGNRFEGLTNKEGGGIYQAGGSLALLNSTIAENEAAYAGGIHKAYGTIALENTLLANNTATGNPDTHNCSGGLIVSSGYNLEDGINCNFNSIGDISGVNPILLPLSSNYGSTLVHPIVMGSPAADSGNNSSCPATDQRGFARPFDGDNDGEAVCDIGAFETDISPDERIYLPVVLRP